MKGSKKSLDNFLFGIQVDPDFVQALNVLKKKLDNTSPISPYAAFSLSRCKFHYHCISSFFILNKYAPIFCTYS